MVATCLDVSQYDLSTFDPVCLKAAGVTDIIFGVFDPIQPPHRMANIAEQWRNAGGNILGFYGFIYFGSPFGVTRDTQWAIQLAQRFGVKRVWLDCEADGLPNGFTDAVDPTPWQRVAEIRQCVDLVRAAGLEPGIYTGSWWWGPNTDHCTAFARLPLWHSDYGVNDGTRNPVTDVAYGGWTKVAIHQFWSQYSVCGRNRDANYVFEEADMTPDEVRAIVRQELRHAEQAGEIIDKRLREVMVKRMTAVQSARTIKAVRVAFDPDHVPGE